MKVIIEISDESFDTLQYISDYVGQSVSTIMKYFIEEHTTNFERDMNEYIDEYFSEIYEGC